MSCASFKQHSRVCVYYARYDRVNYDFILLDSTRVLRHQYLLYLLSCVFLRVLAMRAITCIASVLRRRTASLQVTTQYDNRVLGFCHRAANRTDLGQQCRECKKPFAALGE